MASIGRQRLEKRIQTLVSQVLLSNLNDPRLGFVTVTRAELARDFRDAKIFVSIMGTEAQKRTSMRALEDAVPFVQKRIGPQLHLRHLPRLTFVIDGSVDKSLRMAEIFREIQRERESDGGEESGEPEDEPLR